MITYPALLDGPTELVALLAELLGAERVARGTRTDTRALSCTDQAVFALVWFRDSRDIPLIGTGLGISQATADRSLDEAVRGAHRPAAPTCTKRCVVATTRAAHVVLDGKVVDTDRLRVKKVSTKGTTIDAWYSGKTHDLGGNIHALFRPDGLPIWVFPVEPGSIHDLSAAREHVLGARYAAAGKRLPTLADPGYEGAGHGVHTPVKQPADGTELDINTRTRTALLWALRCLGERGFALLTGRWRTLQHVTVSPSKITKIAQAALVLTHFEHGYLPY
ncbi:MAG: transposase family protein [Pseudonocardiaceae bacterium]